MSASDFMGLSTLVAMEEARDSGLKLHTFDTIAAVEAFKSNGNFLIFFSHRNGCMVRTQPFVAQNQP